MSTLKERLRGAMTIRGLDPDERGLQKRFEKAVKLSGGYVSRLLSGKRGTNMTPAMARKLSEALGIDHEWLVTGEGPAPKDDPELRKRVQQLVKTIDESEAHMVRPKTKPDATGDVDQGIGGIEDMAVMLSLRDVGRAKYPRLEIALLFYEHEPDRWLPATIAAARVGHFEPACQDWTSEEWVRALDAFDRTVRPTLSRSFSPTTIASKKH